MIGQNGRTKVGGTPATPRHTGAEKGSAVAVARRSTPKRAVVVGLLAAAMIASMSPFADAHGGHADKVHACVVSSSGTVRIVGAGESCRNGETPLDWSVGSGIGTGISGDDIIDETITASDLGENSVGTSELGDNSVAAVDLADDSVIGRAIPTDSSLVNIKLGTIRGEANSAPGHVTGDIALGTVSGQGDNDDSVLGDDGNITGNLGLNTVGRRNLVDGAVDASKLSQPFLGDLVTEAEMAALLIRQKHGESGETVPKEPNDGDGFLHWTHLEGLPSEIADGDDNDGSDLVAQLRSDLGSGAGGISIHGRSIRPGSIFANQLAGSDTDADSTIPGDQPVAGAVTSEKILDGTIASRDLDNTLIQLLEALKAKVAALEAEVEALKAG